MGCATLLWLIVLAVHLIAHTPLGLMYYVVYKADIKISLIWPKQYPEGFRGENPRPSSMRAAFILLLLLHAVVHIFWFGHAFGWLDLEYFNKAIPPMVGFSWLLAALFFIASAVQLGNRGSTGSIPHSSGYLISQMWIFRPGRYTQIGSFVNLVS